MSTIRNTSNMDTADMLGFLIGGMGGDASAPILAQEAAGQREVVSSTLIPTDMHNPAEDFEALGFVLGEDAILRARTEQATRRQTG